MNKARAIPVRATVLTPFHYHSLAVQSGTATLAPFIGDRAMGYALANAMGCLAPTPALPKKDYRRDMMAMPWLASVFETREPRLLRPLGKRLNLDSEGGYSIKIQEATSTGNLKTWFFIQEVPPGVVYEGAFFGVDPFDMASDACGRKMNSIVVRTGRHLGGLLRLERSEPGPVRLNLDTARMMKPGAERELGMDLYALHDLQLSRRVSLEEALALVEGWRS